MIETVITSSDPLRITSSHAACLSCSSRKLWFHENVDSPGRNERNTSGLYEPLNDRNLGDVADTHAG